MAHAWSLAVEEQFYLLWPLLFLALYGRSLLTMRRVLMGVIVASIGWRILAHFALGVDKAYLYNASTRGSTTSPSAACSPSWFATSAASVSPRR